MPHRGKRVFNIDLPTSPNAIMRRAKPLPRREQWTRQTHLGELGNQPRVREQPQLKTAVRDFDAAFPLYLQHWTFIHAWLLAHPSTADVF